MAFVITITDPTGATPRTVPARHQRGWTFEGERTWEEGYGTFTLKVPARWDELASITYGDRVEAAFDGERQYRGYIYDIDYSWQGDTQVITYTGSGIAKRAYQIEVPEKEYKFTPGTDRATGWQAIATATVGAALLSLTLTATATGYDAERVGGTYRQFRDVVGALRKGREDKIVAGGDVDGSDGDRLFFKPASASADYTFSVPDTAPNPQTLHLRGKKSTDGLFNRLRIRGATPDHPQLAPNARLMRSIGESGDRTAESLEVADSGGTGTAANVNWEATGELGPLAVQFDVTGAADDDDNDVLFQVRGGAAVHLSRQEQALRLEYRLKGDWPAHIAELEYQDAYGKRVGSVQQTTVAATNYTDFSTVTLAVPSPPAGAIRAVPRLRVRGDGTNLQIDAWSLRDAASTAQEYIDNGQYTVVIDCDDASLVPYGISAAAAASKDNYTGGVAQLAVIEDETVTDLAGARALAALWFNRNAVPLVDPSFCRVDDTNEYWPGEGVTLSGAQGAAVMGGASFLPIASVTLSWPAYGGAYEQRIQCKRPQVTTLAGLAREQKAAIQKQIEPVRAETSTPTTPAAGGIQGPGLRPPRRFSEPQTFDPPAVTFDEHGTATAVGPSQTVADLQDALDGIGGLVGPQSLRAVFRSACYVKTTAADAGARCETTVTHKGTITGWRIEILEGTGTITFEVKRHAYSPTSPDAAYVSITGAAPPTLASGTSASGAPTGWTTTVSEGDEFEFTVTARTGRLQRVVLNIDISPTDADLTG